MASFMCFLFFSVEMYLAALTSFHYNIIYLSISVFLELSLYESFSYGIFMCSFLSYLALSMIALGEVSVRSGRGVSHVLVRLR